MRVLKSLLTTAAVAATMIGSTVQAGDMKIALVVKALGIGFFEAAAKGAEEAAAELGGVDIIYTGPTDTTAEGQIEVINSLIAQGVDAIAISANDPDALVPSLKKAMSRGITVISWDSGVAAEGRQMHLNPSIGRCRRGASNAPQPLKQRVDRQYDHQIGFRSHARRWRCCHPICQRNGHQSKHLDRRSQEGVAKLCWGQPRCHSIWR